MSYVAAIHACDRCSTEEIWRGVDPPEGWTRLRSSSDYRLNHIDVELCGECSSKVLASDVLALVVEIEKRSGRMGAN